MNSYSYALREDGSLLKDRFSSFLSQDYDEVDTYTGNTNGVTQKSPKHSYNSLPVVNLNNRRESTVTLSLSSSASSLQFSNAWYDRLPTQRKLVSSLLLIYLSSVVYYSLLTKEIPFTWS